MLPWPTVSLVPVPMISWFLLLFPFSSSSLWLESRLDSDGDGLGDSLELTLGTSPWDIDSDDDALSDSEEHLSHLGWSLGWCTAWWNKLED